MTPQRPAPRCDCHVHVFEPARFPFAPRRAYTPPPATVDSLIALHRELGIERVVLVQPSVYGFDNRCMLDAIARLGTDRARGIAVVDLDRINQDELDALHAGGVRGLRLNLHVAGSGLEHARGQVRAAGRLVASRGWCLQIHASLDLIAALLEDLRRIECPVVLDHFAGGLYPDPESERFLGEVLAQMQRGPLYVKLSAPYRLWSGPGAQAERLVRTFHAAAPDRVVWGSDWPHTGGSGTRHDTPDGIEPFREIDNAAALQNVLRCLPDDAAREQVMSRTPAALYGFDN